MGYRNLFGENHKMTLTRSKKMIGSILLVVIVAMAGVVVLAQQVEQKSGHEGRGWSRWHRKRGFGGGWGGHFGRNLNLSDAQRQQISQITARYKENFKSLKQTDRHERPAFDLSGTGTFDEAAVRAAAQARANARVEMEVARARMMSEIFNVLTPEQKAQLATERQQREQRRQERQNRRNANVTNN
jgi:Spy/CpxP family protein refolding chaperone